MDLADYYLGDPRLVLVPIEHLTPHGMTAELAALLRERAGWSAARVALFDAAFALYWERSASLARRTRAWPAPRLRHVAVITEPFAVRPYAQLLNAAAWTLHASDLDPGASHPEFVAYLLVHGDRMAIHGEVTAAALHAAAYWLERSEDECAAFVAAATRASRPDADAFRAVANALDWLRGLRHETLRPPALASAHRAIPGTGLLVPEAVAAGPAALVDAWTAVARRTVDAFHARWRASDPAAARALCDWLGAEAPRLLVTGQGGRVVWDPDGPARLGALRHELRQADGVAIAEIAADLRAIDRHTRAFHAALVDPSGLPPPSAATEQRGYTYLHYPRALIAYNLREPGMERLRGPALPFARAMLGARTVHEWAHLAADADWVPRQVNDAEFAQRRACLAAELTAAIAVAPVPLRAATAADLATLGSDPPGEALTDVFLARMPDWQANVLARRFLARAEQETYVRQNVRTLRNEYPPARLWRMLVRYLYEYQYLALSAVGDRRTYFLRSTWFEEDFLTSGVLDERRFDALAAAAAALCASHSVDESRFRAGANA